jgi:hypothetical protein
VAVRRREVADAQRRQLVEDDPPDLRVLALTALGYRTLLQPPGAPLAAALRPCRTAGERE